MGVGRFVLLEPNVQKLLLKLDEPSLADPRSHLRADARRARRRGPRGPATTPRSCRGSRSLRGRRRPLTATVVGDHLVDVEAGDTRERMFGISFDIGTTTVVATLVDLRSGAAAAVESTINRQAPFGADVIARMGHAMTGAEAIGRPAGGRARHRERAHRRGRVETGGSTAARSTRRSWWATPRCSTCCSASIPGPSRCRRSSRPSWSRRTCARPTRASRSTPRAAWRCSRRSARTWAPTSWATSWPPAWRANM